jgi:hypothetical protein
MGASLLYTALFLGNVALFWLWVNYILKAIKGDCPHCGK